MNVEEDEKQVLAELKKIDAELCQINRAIQKLESKKKSLEVSRESLKSKQEQLQIAKKPTENWERTDYPWSKRVNGILKDVFKINSFRPYQISAINAVMSKEDCILVMPTGGGKSLCYQLPAVLMDGITLVVSPLISLMEDQIMALESLNIPAIALTASSTKDDVNRAHAAMIDKNASLKLLYVTPEKLAKSKRFMAKLEKMYQMGSFSLLAIDEVHCCSQWGHDFRTDYKFLGIMKRQFPSVPVLGLTATATAKVIYDVQKLLNIQNCLVLKASFNRPNLKYEVCCKAGSQKESIEQIESLLKDKFKGQSGIIYCFSIKESEEIASELWKRGLKVQSYHAQMTPKNRSLAHKKWISNNLQAVVATIAFGMGIDKPDVRFVIHHSMAKSMENYYQESGRAGRDEKPATCILLYRFADMFRQSTMVFTEQTGQENLYAMVAYCIDIKRCRREIIAEHFGENWNESDCNAMCDHCDNTSKYDVKEKDITKHCQSLFNILDHCHRISERMTAAKLIEAWLGKGPQKLKPVGHNATLLSRSKCERAIVYMLLEGYLQEDFHFTPYSTISYIVKGPKAASVISGRSTVNILMPVLKPELPDQTVVPPPSSSSSVSEKSSSPTFQAAKRFKADLVDIPKAKPCFVNNAKSHFSSSASNSSSTSKTTLISKCEKNVPRDINCTQKGENTVPDVSFDVGFDSDDDDILNEVESTSHYSSCEVAGSSFKNDAQANQKKNVEIIISDDEDLDFGEVEVKRKKKTKQITYIDSD